MAADGDRSWTFTVRQGVTFHDGTKLTARDVVRSLTKAATAAPKPRILDGVNLTVTAENDTVMVTTAKEDPLVPQRLSSPQLSILAAKAYRGKTVNPVGAGTGPFVLKKVNGTSTATLDRNLDKEQITEVPMPRTNTLYLNTERGAFADPALRAAARRAIDAKALVDGVYEGRADVAEGLLGPAIPWAKERPDRTNTTKAGNPRGKTITIGTFTDRAELPEVAASLQQQLQKAEFKVKLTVREYANIESDALAGKFDAFVLSRATVLDSGDPAAYLYSDFASDGSFNIPQLRDRTVDKALHKASASPAGDRRRTAALQAEAAILNTDAAIPMLHERVIQGDAADVVDSAKGPRERLLVTRSRTTSTPPPRPRRPSPSKGV